MIARSQGLGRDRIGIVSIQPMEYSFRQSNESEDCYSKLSLFARCIYRLGA